MSSQDSDSLANDQTGEIKEIASETIEHLLNEVFEQITDKTNKLNYVATYNEALIGALEDIHAIYEKPKPCISHSHIIEAWKRDKPAKSSPPDSLIQNFVRGNILKLESDM